MKITKKKLFTFMEAIDENYTFDALKTEDEIKTRNKNRIKHICLLFLKYIGIIGNEKPRKDISTDKANEIVTIMYLIVSNFSTEEIPQQSVNKVKVTLKSQEYNDLLDDFLTGKKKAWDKWTIDDTNHWNAAKNMLEEK